MVRGSRGGLFLLKIPRGWGSTEDGKQRRSARLARTVKKRHLEDYMTRIRIAG